MWGMYFLVCYAFFRFLFFFIGFVIGFSVGIRVCLSLKGFLDLIFVFLGSSRLWEEVVYVVE